jgi:threonine aldolase
MAAAGLIALDEGPARLVEDHANARRLADGIATVTPEVLDPVAVETNIVFADTRAIGVSPWDGRERLADAGLMVTVVADKVRMLTHRDVSAAEVDDAIGRWRAVIPKLRDERGSR